MIHQIIPISKDLPTIYLGIKEFSPDFIHLIITEETRGIYEEMLTLLPRTLQVKEYVTETYDGRRIEEICRKIHTTYSQDEIIYNLSGSRKIMLIAACSVAFEKGSKAFIISQEDEMILLPGYEHRKLEQYIENEEFITIYDEHLESYTDLDDLKKGDIICARKIETFIERHNDEYTRIKRYFRKRNDEDFTQINGIYPVGDNLEFDLEDGKMRITRKGKVIFQSSCPETAFQFFLGRWWETLVAQQVQIWKQSRKKDNNIWQSVVFTSESDFTEKEDSKQRPPVKNEIDILVNDDSRLLIIECKSGYISQNNIYKMDSVRETYGGDKSVAILISYYPLDEALQEKCEDLDVLYFAPETYEARTQNLHRLPQWLDKVL